MEIIKQPTGFAAFGWGILGFFGGNLIMNAIGLLGVAVIEGLTTISYIYGLLAFPLFALAIFVTIKIRDCREYDATRGGFNVAIVLQCVAVILGFRVGLTG